MPLINCPSCNGQIADDTAYCPHCDAHLGKLEWRCKECGYTDVLREVTFMGSNECQEEHLCPNHHIPMQPILTLRAAGKECPHCGHPYTDERICAVCGQNLVEVLNEEALNDTIRSEQVNRNKYTPEHPYPHH